MTVFIISFFTFFSLYNIAYAHCPLCVVGAGAAATFASWIGVEHVSIGLFIGAFSVALGLWIAKIWERDFWRKKEILTLLSFMLTVIPMMPIIESYFSFYIHISGEYGSILNRTYLVNEFLVGSIIGGLIVIFSPIISKKIKEFRGSLWPYQGLSITFGFLILFSFIFELWL